MRSGGRRRFAGTVALLALMLVSCGDDDDVGDLQAEGGATEEAGVEGDDEERGPDVSRPWPDVDACTLLPGDVLTAVGIDDTDGSPPSDSLFEGPHCVWGIPLQTYVNVVLSGPVTDTTAEFEELYGQIAGRDTYFYTVGGDLGCWMTVDNGDYALEVSLHLKEEQLSELGPVCEATEPLAEAALSALE